uniref:fas-binding factor 1 isoform X2 n=1 Tax=Myxine glutinosa TaxID=7769 RepID=UPI00358F58A5
MASKKGLRDSIGGIFADLLEDDINVSSAQADSKTESQGVLSARSSLDEDENYFGKLGKNLSRTINAMDDESGTAEPGQATAGGILKSRSSRTDQLEMEAKAVKDTNLSLASIRHPRKISFDDEDVLGPLGLEDKKENELEQPARKSGREYWDYPDSPNRNTSPKSPAPAVPHDWLGRKPSMLERSTSDFEVEEKVPAFGSYRPSFSSSAARCQPPPLSRQSSMLSNGVNIAGYSQLRPDNWDTKKPDQKVSTSRVTNEKRSGEKQQPSIRSDFVKEEDSKCETVHESVKKTSKEGDDWLSRLLARSQTQVESQMHHGGSGDTIEHFSHSEPAALQETLKSVPDSNIANRQQKSSLSSSKSDFLGLKDANDDDEDEDSFAGIIPNSSKVGGIITAPESQRGHLKDTQPNQRPSSSHSTRPNELAHDVGILQQMDDVVRTESIQNGALMSNFTQHSGGSEDRYGFGNSVRIQGAGSLQNDQNAGQTRCTAPAQSGMKTGAIKERITSTPHKCKNALQLVESTVSSLAVDHSSDKELHATRDVEIKLHQLEVENVQLKAFLEAQQKRHEQELVSLEDMYKWRNKLQSESMDLREARLQAEMNELTAMLKTVRNESEAERTRLMEASAQRLADADRERNRDFERLRELQRKAVSEMQKDYEEQMQRLRRLKDQEVDAVTSATAQTRSLSTVIEHMEAFSQRLGELASQLDGYRKNSRQDADFEMRQREQQIKALQNSLESQRKDLQQERSELHKVISRLEARLQEQTRLLEEERHRLLAERSKTEALQGSMAENMRAMLEQRDLEREELQKAKMKLLLEREEWERNCLDVPKGLGREHSELGQQRKQFASRCEHKVTDVAAKGGFYVGLAQREAKEQVTRDLAQLEQQRNAIRVEAAHLSAHKKKLARQAEEVRIANKVIANHLFASLIFLQLASQKYAEGEQALQEVRHVLAVDRGRVGRTKLQTWGVYEQEKGLVQNSLGNLVKRKLTSTKVSGALSDRLEPSLSALTTDDSQTHLAFFKHMASQDHDFIKREDLFLMNLRKHQLHGQFTTA